MRMEEEKIGQSKEKRSVSEILSLFIRGYRTTLMYKVIPLSIFILQIIQVWADSIEVQFKAKMIKYTLVLIFTGYAVTRLRQHIRQKSMREEESSVPEIPLFVAEEPTEETGLITEGEIAAVPAVREKESVITEDMYIHGDIETNKDLIVYGDIDGNINCSGNVRVYGLVGGNIRCKNLYLDKTEVEGDIQCEERVYVSHECTVIGNIVAWEMVCKGRIRGNAYIRRKVRLEKSTQLIGDVTSMEIVVQEGATIQGNMHIQMME